MERGEKSSWWCARQSMKTIPPDWRDDNFGRPSAPATRPNDTRSSAVMNNGRVRGAAAWPWEQLARAQHKLAT